MNDVIGSVRQALQDFLAPELRQHRAELVAIRGELSAKIEAVESKIGAVETRLDSKIDAVEARLESKINMVDSKINVVDSKIDVVKSEMRSGFSGLGAALENAVFRGELSTTREIADLRIRVERLERERGQLPQ
jgi:chromosome segregation ATPase